MRKHKLFSRLLVFLLSVAISAGLMLPTSGVEKCYAAAYLSSPGYSLSRLTSGVKISWTKVPKATKYRVYKKSSGTWKVIATVSSAKTAYIDRTARRCGSSYRYSVRAMNSTKTSRMDSTGKVIKTSHSYKVTTSRPATCTSKSIKYYQCRYCDKIKFTAGDIYLKHTYTKWKVITPASDTSEGLRRRTCTECGAVATSPMKSDSPIVQKGLQYVGNRYKLHGTSYTEGIDCSNFVYNLLHDTIGFNRPYRYSTDWLSYGKKVSSIADAKTGDILVFDGHVAIFMSRGRVIHASKNKPYPEGGIRIETFTSNTKLIRYFEETRKEKLLGIRRFTELDSSNVIQIQSPDSDSSLILDQDENNIIENLPVEDVITEDDLTTNSDTGDSTLYDYDEQKNLLIEDLLLPDESTDNATE